MNKYTQRQWDRTVGYGKVPDEYSIELKQENKVLRKMIYSLSRDSKESYHSSSLLVFQPSLHSR